MGLLSWILLGALAGWIATMITGTNGRYGAFANIMFGIVGAFIGGFIASLLGGSEATLADFSIYSFIVAIAGASLVIWSVQKMGTSS